MEPNTNRQLAERLTALAKQLVLNGDTLADSTVSAAVAALEQAAILPKKLVERPADTNVVGANFDFGGSKDLSEVVEKIKLSSSPGQPLSARFRNEVTQHDRTRCIASIVFEDLWNGFDGWKPANDFWKMVVFVWRNAPDFFEDYDPEREIKEDPSRWTQRYFDEQRNFLRHNFCLKRLCHLVMVYEHLHGEEAAVKKPAPVQSPSTKRYNYPQVPASPPPNAKRGFLSRFSVIACLVLTALVSVYLLGARSSETQSECVTTRPKAENPKATRPEVVQKEVEQPILNQASQTQEVDDKSTNMTVATSVQKQDVQSNNVVKSAIALQETVPQTSKAPVVRAGNVANKQ